MAAVLILITGFLIYAQPRSTLFHYILIKINQAAYLYVHWPGFVLLDILGVFFKGGTEDATATAFSKVFEWEYREFLAEIKKHESHHQ